MMPSQSWVTNSHFDLHLVAKRLGDVDVEALELAVGGEIVERRVGAFGADLDGLLGAGRAEREGKSCRRYGKGHAEGTLHLSSSILVPPPAAGGAAQAA